MRIAAVQSFDELRYGMNLITADLEIADELESIVNGRHGSSVSGIAYPVTPHYPPSAARLSTDMAGLKNKTSPTENETRRMPLIAIGGEISFACLYTGTVTGRLADADFDLAPVAIGRRVG